MNKKKEKNENQNNKIPKTHEITRVIFKYILTFFIVIIIFVGLLTLSSTFPQDWIQKNMEKSVEELYEEGIPSNILGIYFDSASDTTMLNAAYSIDSRNPLESAMLARIDYVPEKQQKYHEDTITLDNVKVNEGYNVKEQLKKTVDGDIKETYEYARYWHGYISIIRPLLIFFSFNEIRKILICVFAMLAMLLMMLLYKKINFKYCFIIILSLLVSEYFFMGLNLQGTFTFIIAMLASIIICIRFEKIKNIGLYFFVIGMATCYFDLLTHPIITLGIPMIIYLLLKQKVENVSLKDSIKFIILNTLLWGIGWIAANVAKWVIVDILYNRDLIHKSLLQFYHRSQRDYSTTLVWYDGLRANILYSKANTITYLVILAIYFVSYLIKNYKRIYIDIKGALPYFIISLMPIAWLILMRNHTLSHMYFTWRMLIVFYIGIGVFFFKLFGEKEVMDKTEDIDKEGNDKSHIVEDNIKII
mgnify:FL=1|jgi:hypothetical protein